MTLTCENELRKHIEETKEAMSLTLSEYKTKCKTADQTYAKWTLERKNAESLVKGEIDALPGKLRKAVHAAIEANKDKTLPLGCDFDKFCYYYDGIKGLKYNRKQLKVNPNFLHGIIEELSIEYLRIFRHLANEEPSKKGDKDTWKAEGKTKVESLYNDLDYNYFYDMATDEVEKMEEGILADLELEKGSF